MLLLLESPDSLPEISLLVKSDRIGMSDESHAWLIFKHLKKVLLFIWRWLCGGGDSKGEIASHHIIVIIMNKCWDDVSQE